jgi:hypothetical protein
MKYINPEKKRNAGHASMDGKCTPDPGRLLSLDFWAVLFVRMLPLLSHCSLLKDRSQQANTYILFWQIPRQSGRQMMLIDLGGSLPACAALVYETEKRVMLMHALHSHRTSTALVNDFRISGDHAAFW